MKMSSSIGSSKVKRPVGVNRSFWRRYFVTYTIIANEDYNVTYNLGWLNKRKTANCGLS